MSVPAMEWHMFHSPWQLDPCTSGHMCTILCVYIQVKILMKPNQMSYRRVQSLLEKKMNLQSVAQGPHFLQDPSLGESQHFELNCSVSEEKAKVPFPENIKRSFLEFIKKPSIRRLFAPAIIGAIVGLMIGIIPPFRKVLIGDRAPLHAVEDSADMVGKAAIPIITLILGANLLKGLKGSKVPLLVIIGIVAISLHFLQQTA
uniref:Uncharacterized protein n=1 Tax=Populus trichocarpa TaxID=3694 RepID=A0A3N7E990_POPTR